MKRIGILSDTHGCLHPKVIDFFSGMDEIWHAGDIGNIQTALKLSEKAPLRAVYGNIDGHDVRLQFPEFLIFRIEQVKVFMIHIGGYPGRYATGIRQVLDQEKPLLFVCGHSHILKVMFDKNNKLLYINPGAAGKSGLHRSITAVRLIIEDSNLRDLEVLDIPR